MNSPRTLGAVCYQAGKAFKRINPHIADQEAAWIPGISLQGEQSK